MECIGISEYIEYAHPDGEFIRISVRTTTSQSIPRFTDPARGLMITDWIYDAEREDGAAQPQLHENSGLCSVVSRKWRNVAIRFAR